MANKEPEVRIVLTMPRKLVDRIDDYRFAHRLLSRAAAIRELTEAGLLQPQPRRGKGSPKPSTE
jgi:metal-responsive CopG/Arc/MetJ family transcriptional regulator